jgi:hypothetical protein
VGSSGHADKEEGIYKNEKDKKTTNGSKGLAINNSFFKPTVIEVNSKHYLEAKVFEKDDDPFFGKISRYGQDDGSGVNV